MRGLCSSWTSCFSSQRREMTPSHTKLTSRWVLAGWQARPAGGVACCVPSAPHKLCSLLQCGNLMLVEIIAKEPLSFSVFDYKNPKIQHTVQVTGQLLLGPHMGEVHRVWPPSLHVLAAHCFNLLCRPNPSKTNASGFCT